jgi:hypothetical protein
MTRTNANDRVAAVAASAQDRAREVAAKVRPAAAQVMPLAKSTQDAARRGMLATRAWAAPQIERTGQALQDNVAPKVADMLSSAAHRIEPEKPRSRNWWTLSGMAILVAAAASAAAAALRKRAKSSAMPAAETDTAGPEAAVDAQPSDDADPTRAGHTF